MSRTDIESINGLHTEALAAASAGDLARIMNLWTEDGVRMPPNEPTAIGRASIEAQYRAMLDQFTTDLRVHSEETEVFGDWAHSRWTCSGVFAPKAGGEPIRGEFKCVDIFRRQQDGTWKMVLHIWNSNELLPALETNKALFRRWGVEGMNKGNIALFDEIYGDCVYHAPAIGELKREAFKQWVASTFSAFPDGHYTIEDQVAEGDKVATRWTLTATHRGELMGMAPTGRRVTTSGMSIDRIVDGKIVEEREEWDTFGWMQQLGAGTESAAANKSLVRRYFEEVANNKNPAALEELFAGDSVFAAPYFPKLQGLKGRNEAEAVVHSAYPDGHYTVKELIAEGNNVVARWTFRGTHKGELMGVAPTGKKVSLTGTSTFAISGGKIVSEWADYDALGQWQQLGVIPPLERAIVKTKTKAKAQARPKAKPKVKPRTRPKTKSTTRARRQGR